MTRLRAAARASLFLSILFCLATLGAQTPQGPSTGSGEQIVPNALRARAARDGRVRVIVELKLAGGHVPEGQLRASQAVADQRRDILAAATRVTSRLPGLDRRLLRRYDSVPYVALEVGPAALAALEQSTDVARVMDDEIVFARLADSVPLIQADQAWGAGYDGTGTTIAIVDTGVDSNHPFLAGKVTDEACFSAPTGATMQTTCPNGTDQQIGAGAAVPCSLPDCLHGTHVAGIAAGNGDQAGQTFSGVAKGAHLVAVQVFTVITDSGTCGSLGAPCAGAFASDIIAGLEFVYSLALSRNIVAANMSLGGSSFTTTCDTQPYKPAIDNLRSIGVATVVAAGNSGSGNSLASPACISTAISVGSTDKDNQVSSYSDVASFMSLFAPGRAITSSVPNGGYHAYSGTSMATPHVSGAWAILRQAAPGAGVSLVLNALRQTGLPITDNRPQGFGTTVPRISVFEAMNSLVPVNHPAPSLASVTPTRVRAGMGPVNLTLTGTGFDAFSVVKWNGVAQQTSVVSTTQVLAQIPQSALVGGTTAQVTVVAPAPGGGTTASLPVIIDPPPTLSLGAATVTPSSPIVVTLANGFGGSTDWLALSAVGSSNSSYINFVYVGAGITDKSFTFTSPSVSGSYEFRLYLNNGYTRVATSAPFTVDASLNPQPSISSLSPSSTPAGGAGLTLTINGSGFVSSSTVRWNGSARSTTFVNGSQLQASLTAADLSAAGTASVTVFSPTPGGGTSSPATFTVNPPTSLSVSASTVQPGAPITVTLTNGAGGATDWLAFAATSAPNTSYNSYTFVGSGVTNRTWTVNAPSSPGTYEFRYFLNGGYTRAATSPPVSVQSSSNPAPTLTSLSPNSTAAGSPDFTLTVNGTGFIPSSVVRWNGTSKATTYVSATQLRAAIAATDVATSGSATVTVFTPAPGGGTSPGMTFTITSGSAQPPALTVSSTSVPAGASITVTLTNGLGGSGDWLSFASTAAPNTSYINFTYVGTGVTTRTWTVTAPGTAGTYEFRLFPNNGYTRAATSPSVTVTVVQNPTPPTLTVNATTVSPGASVTVTLTNGAGGAWDWLALAGTNAPNTSYAAFTYVGGGVTTRTWTVTMPSTPGTYEFRLFANNGYTRLATSPVVTVQ